MAKYTKDAAISILHRAAVKYHELLSQKQFLLIYNDKLTNTIKTSI